MTSVMNRFLRIWEFPDIFQPVRRLSEGNAVVKNKPRSSDLKRVKLLQSELEKRNKRRKKKGVIFRKKSDEVESLWLENLTLDNLKLYRQTSFGSFRKVNLTQLLERLKKLDPNLFTDLNKSNLTSLDVTETNTKEEKTQLASPNISEFLLNNMTNFPLLKNDNNFSSVLKEDKEDFGLVDSVKFPSVTRILSETMSETARARLKEWKERMIEHLGEDMFIKYQQDLLSRGVKFHECVRKYLESGDERQVTIDPRIEGCWKSLEKLLPEISNVQMTETSVYHPVLMYKGVVDCVASYRDIPCVIEWKKSDKIKSDLSSTYDAPLQLCAYLGALAWQPTRLPTPLTSGLVVVAYTSGAPANVFFMDLEHCEIYWVEWLRRLQSYWKSKRRPMLEEVFI